MFLVSLGYTACLVSSQDPPGGNYWVTHRITVCWHVWYCLSWYILWVNSDISFKRWCSFIFHKNGCHFMSCFIISSLVISTLSYHFYSISWIPYCWIFSYSTWLPMIVCSSIRAFFFHNFLYLCDGFWTTATIFWNFSFCLPLLAPLPVYIFAHTDGHCP